VLCVNEKTVVFGVVHGCNKVNKCIRLELKRTEVTLSNHMEDIGGL
jgi:hypothetical protein